MKSVILLGWSVGGQRGVKEMVAEEGFLNLDTRIMIPLL